MYIYPNITETIGHTPLVKLKTTEVASASWLCRRNCAEARGRKSGKISERSDRCQHDARSRTSKTDLTRNSYDRWSNLRENWHWASDAVCRQRLESRTSFLPSPEALTSLRSWTLPPLTLLRLVSARSRLNCLNLSNFFSDLRVSWMRVKSTFFD